MLLLLTDEGVETLRTGEPGAPATALLASADLVLHRILLADPGPAGRMAEAMMRATDLAAQPATELHLALGPVEADGSAWLALIGQAQMAAHMARLEAAGVDPAHILPAALLLAAPAGGTPTSAGTGSQLVLRGPDYAGTAEAGLLPAGRAAPLEQAMATDRLDHVPDLRSGAFARRLRWWREGWFRWSAAGLVAAALLLLAAPPFLRARQDRAVVAEHDAATMAAARQALQRDAGDAPAAAVALADARRARESGRFGPRLTYLAATLATMPGVRLESLVGDGRGALVATLAGAAEPVNAARGALASGGFTVTGSGATISIGDRRGAQAVATDAGAVALVRRINALSDAAILARPAPPDGMADAAIAAEIAAAGLPPAAIANGAIIIPAARPTLLLPLIADLEAKGLRFTAIAITPNPDQSVSATLEPAP